MNAFTQKPKQDPKFASFLRRSAAGRSNGRRTGERYSGMGELRETPKHGAQQVSKTSCACQATES